MPLGRTFSTQNTTVFFQVDVHTHRVDKMVVINTISTETGSWEKQLPLFLKVHEGIGSKKMETIESYRFNFDEVSFYFLPVSLRAISFSSVSLTNKWRRGSI